MYFIKNVLNHLRKEKVILAFILAIAFSLYAFIFSLMFFLGKFTADCLADECRYINNSRNLLNWFNLSSGYEIDIWSGPGYSIFLMPFVALDSSRVTLIFANVLLSLVAVFLLFRAARIFLSIKRSVIISLIWILYYPHFPEIFSVLTEPLTTVLVLSITLFIFKLFTRGRAYYGFIAGLFLGFLILTKVIFAYVLIVAFVVNTILYFISSYRSYARQVFVVLCSAFIITVPYQFFTYNLTGKIYYFSNAGGSAIYFMSSPHAGEFGEWNNSDFTANCGFAADVPCNRDKFARNHAHIFEKANSLNPFERDDFLKKIALENIKADPLKYFRNYVNNISRMLYNIPNSYFYQREQTIFRLVPNSLVFTFIILAVWFTFKNFRAVPRPVLIAISFVFIYLLLQAAVSSYPRQFNVVLPVIFIWIGVAYCQWLNEVKSRESPPNP